MKIVTPDSIKYVQQTEALNEIAAKLEVVAYRPSHHGLNWDKNTVMFYTPEDAEHNRLVAQQPVQYTRIEAANRKKLDGVAVPDEFIYRDSFWSFENSDVNGLFNVGYANHGRLNLQQPDWKDRLEGHIGFTLLRRRQHQYLRMTGGWDALREADETYNNFNRSIIAYMKKAYGQLYLGSVNYHPPSPPPYSTSDMEPGCGYSDTLREALPGWPGPPHHTAPVSYMPYQG